MIISRTPFRVSFFGGGTDYPAWYRAHGGSVLATTIDKYCYISCRHLPPFFHHKHRIVYSKVEEITEVESIQHPAVKAVLQVMEVNEGLELHHDGDLPARSGLGSSSSFTVGLINAIKALRGQIISKHDLAKQAIHIEQEVIGEPVGSQDQVSAAFGGFNRIDFSPDDTFNVNSLIVNKERKEELESHLMLFFTGISRFSSEIAKTKIANLSQREQDLKVIRAQVDEAVSILQSPSANITEFGKLLHEAWRHKWNLSKAVSSEEIDQIYQTGLSAGALGGKLLGAGGGGFMLFFVKPEDQPRIREALRRLISVSFKFENDGSKIIVYNPTG